MRPSEPAQRHRFLVSSDNPIENAFRRIARRLVFFNFFSAFAAAFLFFPTEAVLGPPQSVPLPFFVDFLCTTTVH